MKFESDPMNPTLQRRPSPRELLVQTAKVAGWGALCGTPIAVFFGRISGQTWQYMFSQPLLLVLYGSAIGAIFAAVFYITCGLPWPFLNPYLRVLSKPLSDTLKVAIAMVGGSSGCVISFALIKVLFKQVEIPLPLGTMALIDGLIAVIITFIIGTVHKSRADRELRERTLSEAAAKAQSHALQAQINPHFFFNTLNTISALIPIDPAAAQKTIGVLADMFRYTLNCSQAELVELGSEMEFVKSYLQLEQARFRDRLKVELPPSSQTQDVLVPGLTLQPLVENAIRHGIAQRIEGGLVRVEVERNNGTCRVNVVNPRDRDRKLGASEFFPAGHALANIRDRLALAFPNRSALKIGLEDRDWVTVSVELPVRSARG